MATGPTRITDWQGSVYAAILEENVQIELRLYNVIRPFTRKGVSGPSQVYSFNVFNNNGVTDVNTGLGESADLITNNLHQFTMASVANATAAILGIMAAATDFLKSTSILDVPGQLTGLLVRSMLQRYETDAVAQGTTGSAFTPSVGDSVSNMSLSRHYAAVSKLEQQNNVADLVEILHTKQTGDLRQDLIGLNASALVSQIPVAGIMANELNGYVGTLGRVTIFHTNATPNSAGLITGQMFAVNSAIGEYSKWLEQVEFQRDASFLRDEFVCSSAYGFATIDVNRGCLVKSAS